MEKSSIEFIKNNINNKTIDSVFDYIKEVWNTLSHEEKEDISKYVGSTRYKNKFHVYMDRYAKDLN